MSTPPASTEDHHELGRYEIRIKGHLDNRWADWFDGLTITLVGQLSRTSPFPNLGFSARGEAKAGKLKGP